ncbi:hypothetical protein Hanom_Chr06g00501251 [Helianthus anomalus]
MRFVNGYIMGCLHLFLILELKLLLMSIKGPCFCRHMNRADEVILSIPSDAACKLWGVDKGPTNVMIQTEDGRMFNVSLSESKGK